MSLRLALTLLLGLPPAAIAMDQPHQPRRIDSALCDGCHTRLPDRLPGAAGGPSSSGPFAAGGIAMCMRCHEHEARAHPMGRPLEFPVPPDLPLEGGAMTCLTCHHAHGSLQSDRPWASVSLMDRLTDSERMHKSYLLRRNNANGELCLVCHDTRGERP